MRRKATLHRSVLNYWFLKPGPESETSRIGHCHIGWLLMSRSTHAALWLGRWSTTIRDRRETFTTHHGHLSPKFDFPTASATAHQWRCWPDFLHQPHVEWRRRWWATCFPRRKEKWPIWIWELDSPRSCPCMATMMCYLAVCQLSRNVNARARSPPRQLPHAAAGPVWQPGVKSLTPVTSDV